jgi:hypothetical protein
MEIKPLATKRGPKSAMKSQRLAGDETGRVRHVSHPSRINGGPSPSSPSSSSSSDVNTLYFHKSHQGENLIIAVESRTQSLTQFTPSILKGGILVCEVAIQEPFFYTKVYALEMSRLLQVGTGGSFPNVAHIASAQAHYTDRFLNECDHIKVMNPLAWRTFFTFPYVSLFFLRFYFTCTRSRTTSTFAVSTRSSLAVITY